MRKISPECQHVVIAKWSKEVMRVFSSPVVKKNLIREVYCVYTIFSKAQIRSAIARQTLPKVSNMTLDNLQKRHRSVHTKYLLALYYFYSDLSIPYICFLNVI